MNTKKEIENKIEELRNELNGMDYRGKENKEKYKEKEKELFKLESELYLMSSNHEKDENVLDENTDIIDFENENQETDDDNHNQKIKEKLKNIDYAEKGKEIIKVTEEGWKKSKPYRDKVKRKMFGFNTSKAEELIYNYHHSEKPLNYYRNLISNKKESEMENEDLIKELSMLEAKRDKAISKGNQEEKVSLNEEIKGLKKKIDKNDDVIERGKEEVKIVSNSPEPFLFKWWEFKSRFELMLKGIPVGYHILNLFLSPIIIYFFFNILLLLVNIVANVSLIPLYVLFATYLPSLLIIPPSILYFLSFYFNKRIANDMYRDKELNLYDSYSSLYFILKLMDEFTLYEDLFEQTIKKIANHEGRVHTSLNNMSDVPSPQMDLINQPLDETKGDIEVVEGEVIDGNNNPLKDKWIEIQKNVFGIREEEKFTFPNYKKGNEYYDIHILKNPYITLHKARQKRYEIQGILDKEIFSISKDGVSGIKFEIIMKDFESEGLYKISDINVKPSKSSSVILAKSVKGWHEWDLDNPITPHLALAGTSGSGKSAFAYSIIDGLVKQDMMLIFADPKWSSFPRYRKKGYTVLRDNNEIADMMIKLKEEIDKRNTLFEENDSEKLSQYNRKNPDNPLPRIVFILDEFATFTSDNGKEGEFTRSEYEYEMILRMGRSAGIHLMVMFQDPLAESFGGGKYRNLYTYLIAGFLSKDNYSEMMLGTGNTQASDEKKTGTFYINGEDPQIIKCRSPFVDVDGGEPDILRDNMPYNKYEKYILGENDNIIRQKGFEEIISEEKEFDSYNKEMNKVDIDKDNNKPNPKQPNININKSKVEIYSNSEEQPKKQQTDTSIEDKKEDNIFDTEKDRPQTLEELRLKQLKSIKRKKEQPSVSTWDLRKNS